MASFERFRKLKSANSLETSCTWEETSDRDIKITIQPPKIDQKNHKLTSDSIELVIAEGPVSSPELPAKSLISIPVLSRKHGEGGILVASNSSQPLQSQRLPFQDRVVLNSADLFTESLEMRSMRVSHRSREIVSDGQPSSNYINKPIAKPSATNQKAQKAKGAELRKEEECKWTEQQSKAQERKRCETQYFYDEKTVKGNTNAADSTASALRRQPFNFKPILHQLRLSSKYDQIPQLADPTAADQRSTSRPKLRDYLHRMETSSKQTRRQLASPDEHSSPPAELFKVRSEQKIPYQPQTQTVVSPSSNQTNSKYGISNRQMLAVLKQEILEEVRKAQSQLKTISNAIAQGEHPAQPCDEELLVFYNLRRRMKEDVNKRLADALQLLSSDEKEAIY